MALVQLPTVEESITALVKLHNFQLSETSHLRYFPPSKWFVLVNNFSFQGLLLQKHNLEGRGTMNMWTLEPFVPSLKIIGSFCHLKVLQYWFHAVCCIGRGYLHKFIFGTHGFFLPWALYMPSTYLFPSSPKIHWETWWTFEIFLNSLLSTTLETRIIV